MFIINEYFPTKNKEYDESKKIQNNTYLNILCEMTINSVALLKIKDNIIVFLQNR